MKNKDFAALKRTEILNRMNAAVAENDSEAFSKAYLELCQDIEENVLEQAKELVNQSDMNVLHREACVSSQAQKENIMRK